MVTRVGLVLACTVEVAVASRDPWLLIVGAMACWSSHGS